MVDIIVHEGEYEYLMRTDPNFVKFVRECEGKSIEQIVEDLKIHDKIHDKIINKEVL